MLVQEAHAMARLSHPNIVVIHDIIDVEDTFAIAMEWIDGRTLASLLRTLSGESGPDDMALLRASLGTPDDEQSNFEATPERHFVRLMHDIALATQTVHDNGLLHLDIKPSNVLVRRDGTPLLADFGVTRDTSHEWNETRTFAGTPVYAAPEQLRRDDKNIGPHTDVYSLGVTLYEALARCQPLQGKDLPSIVHCIESGAMPRLTQYAEVSADLENIVHKAIAPEPEHRYQSAAELAADLAAYLDHRPVVARPLRPLQRMRRWARNEPWKAGLAATLAVVLPLIAWLGSYLASNWSTLRAAEYEQNFAIASDIKQTALQRWLTNEIPTTEAIASLEKAIAIDPTDSSIVCLLTLANEDGWPAVQDAIQKQTKLADSKLADSKLGIALFAKKAAERRSFFNDSEVRQLHASESLGDRYMLALDYVFRANDDRLETTAKLAQEYLEFARSSKPDDPLLHGLIAWFAIRAGDTESCESSQRTIWHEWPRNADALAWTTLAIEPSNPDKAKQLARKIIEELPENPRGYELLAGAEARSRQPEAALAVLEEAALAKVSPAIPEHLVLRIKVGMGDQAAIQARIALAKRDDHLMMELQTLRFAKDEQRLARYREIAELPSAPPKVLEEAYVFSESDPDVNERIWQRYWSLYPDRKRILEARFRNLYPSKPGPLSDSDEANLEEAAKIAKEITADIRDIDAYSARAGRALMFVRDWQHLIRTAKRWQQFGSQPAEAAFYAAVGYSRLQQHEDAASHLSDALAITQERKSWYVSALLEAAWLQCSPEVPERLHKPKIAKAYMDEFLRLNPRLRQPHAGPWTDLIIGEVLLANGDKQGATQRFQDGLEHGRKREVLAPSDYRARLEAALERARR